MNKFDQFLLAKRFNPEEEVQYSPPFFRGQLELFEYFDDIIRNNRKVNIYGDCDIDGLMSLLEVEKMFLHFGHRNYNLWNYKNRNHEIDNDFVFESIVTDVEYVIILDVGTNEMNKIEALISSGLKVIIIDHHKSVYKLSDYPGNCVIINTTMLNQEEGANFTLSAGSLTFCLLYNYTIERGRPLKSLSIYGLISLYSDCIDMSKKLNRSIYFLALSCAASEYPFFVEDLLNKQIFRRRFIEFSLCPKINALFRSENFKIINEYFLESTKINRRSGLLAEILRVYEESKVLVDKVSDLIEKEVLDNFVVSRLDTCGIGIEENKLYNYTGLIANKVMQTYGKPCIVISPMGESFKGSFRDLLGRDYLTTFKQFCECGGHNAAFGLHIKPKDLDYFYDILRGIIDKQFSNRDSKELLEVEMPSYEPDMYVIRKMAKYNEFSGNELPAVLIKKRNMFVEEKKPWKSTTYTYLWGERIVESYNKLVAGAMLNIKPILSSDIRLIVYEKGDA